MKDHKSIASVLTTKPTHTLQEPRMNLPPSAPWCRLIETEGVRADQTRSEILIVAI